MRSYASDIGLLSSLKNNIAVLLCRTPCAREAMIGATVVFCMLCKGIQLHISTIPVEASPLHNAAACRISVTKNIGEHTTPRKEHVEYARKCGWSVVERSRTVGGSGAEPAFRKLGMATHPARNNSGKKYLGKQAFSDYL
jgi:hypothetical protein